MVELLTLGFGSRLLGFSQVINPKMSELAGTWGLFSLKHPRKQQRLSHGRRGGPGRNREKLGLARGW